MYIESTNVITKRYFKICISLTYIIWVIMLIDLAYLE